MVLGATISGNCCIKDFKFETKVITCYHFNEKFGLFSLGFLLIDLVVC